MKLLAEIFAELAKGAARTLLFFLGSVGVGAAAGATYGAVRAGSGGAMLFGAIGAVVGAVVGGTLVYINLEA
ncbi:MAG: hypothetical protein AAFP86_00300 [Planctomycetota bacterium]